MLSDWGISLPSSKASSDGVLMLIPDQLREMLLSSTPCHFLAAAVPMMNKPVRSNVAKIKP